MAFQAKSAPEFEPCTELNAKWFEDHKDHHIIQLKHTIFNGGNGVEYLECRCYLCRKIAQKRLRKVHAVSEIHVKNPRKTKD